MAASTIDEYRTTVPASLTSVADTLRDLLDNELAGAEGTVWHGHPVWRIGATPVAGFKAHRSSVTLMLWRGAEIDDPTGRLQRSGSATLATVKLAGTDDIDTPAVRSWLRQVLQRHTATPT